MGAAHPTRGEGFKMSQCIVCGEEGRGTLAHGAWYPDDDPAWDNPEMVAADAYEPMDAVEDSYEAYIAQRYDFDGEDALPDDLDDAPDIETLMQWEMDGVCEALDGCLVEPDGICPHGSPSWLVYLGYC